MSLFSVVSLSLSLCALLSMLHLDQLFVLMRCDVCWDMSCLLSIRSKDMLNPFPSFFVGLALPLSLSRSLLTHFSLSPLCSLFPFPFFSTLSSPSISHVLTDRTPFCALLVFVVVVSLVHHNKNENEKRKASTWDEISRKLTCC